MNIRRCTNDSLAATISAVGTEDFFTRVTEYLQSIVGFIGIFVTELEGKKQPTHIYDNVRSERRLDVVDTYIERNYLLDPFFNSNLKSPGTKVHRLVEISPDRFQSSTYYERYYKGLKLKDEIGLFVQISEKNTLFYSLGRHTHEKRFSKAETKKFREILPVVEALSRRHFDGFRHGGSSQTVGRDVDEAMLNFGEKWLTPRESEIAGLILKGHSSHSIAAQTGTTIGTTKIHRKNLYRKLNISSQAELFHAFFESVFE